VFLHWQSITQSEKNKHTQKNSCEPSQKAWPVLVSVFFSIFPILFVQLSKAVGNSKWQTDKVRLNGCVYFLLDVKLAVKFKFPINEGTQLGQLFKLFV